MGAEEPQRGNTRNTMGERGGGREVFPCPPTGGGGTAGTEGGALASGSIAAAQGVLAPPMRGGGTASADGGTCSLGSIFWRQQLQQGSIHPKSKGRVFKRGDVGEDKFPQNEFLEAKAIVEGGINDQVGTTGKGVFSMIGTQHSNQPNDNASLIAEVMEISRRRKKRRGDEVGRGRGVGSKGERQGGNAEAYNAGEEGADIYFFDVIPLRVRGRKQGQCHPRSRGRHLHSSPVQAQTCWW
jgi:hypothetical protein